MKISLDTNGSNEARQVVKPLVVALRWSMVVVVYPQWGVVPMDTVPAHISDKNKDGNPSHSSCNTSTYAWRCLPPSGGGKNTSLKISLDTNGLITTRQVKQNVSVVLN